MKKLTILICICLLLSLSGCILKIPPPSLERVNNVYSEYKEEITTVVNYLINTEYDTVLITDTSGKMSVYSYQWSDIYFQDREISDQKTKTAVARLFDQGIVKSFDRSYGEIQIRIWTRKEVYCYIAYRGDGAVPSVEHATEIMPMDEEGWYYVIADYNEWRVREREAGVTRPGIVKNESGDWG